MKQPFFALALFGIITAATGCGKQAAPVGSSTALAATPAASTTKAAPAPAAAKLTDAELAKFKPNEVGQVPILEYHSIGPGKTSMDRTAAAFRHDLERLYAEGYRPVALRDYLDDHIALPPGKSPVIFTFDDARESQFRYRPDGSLDPDCALGILQAFAKTHPDFPAKATFYVLPLSAFGQPADASKKMQALLAQGFEIGNHTVSHNRLDHMSDADVQKELGNCVALIHKLAPQAQIDTVALPLGIAPRNRALLASGEYQGQHYANRAVLLVGAGPAPSPVAAKFKPMRLPRIQANELPYGITFWLDILKRHPNLRFVSDGDPNTVTVPRSQADKVDKSHLNGLTLRTY
jgi:peptidoglycan/xylan/chitin deacetylase (PgdA/CDA1 family)